ncbi:maleylpyruvate isomerase N-terminal domain-containing protein [Angustibacter peucedani]
MTEAALLLAQGYEALAELVRGLDDDASWAATGCTGWSARDLVLHCLGDAQRALVALHTPADGPADLDAVSYWRESPAAGVDGRTAAQAAADGRRWTRVAATMFRDWSPLQALHLETAAAVVRAAAEVEPDALLATQGHVLRADDLLSTLVVEVTLHHLDLLVGQPAGTPGPSSSGLREVRRVLDGLAGAPAGDAWTDERWALVATGRAEPTDAERAALGDLAARLPLLS